MLRPWSADLLTGRGHERTRRFKCDARFSTSWPVSAVVVVVMVLAVAGSLLMVGYNFANNYVHTQLAEQQIAFPPAAAFAHPVPGQRDHTSR